MGSAQAIRTCLTKSFQFSGRTSRPEFWWFALLWLPFACVVSVLVSPTVFSKVHLFGALFLRVVAFLPLLSAAARRGIDAGYDSAWIGRGFSCFLLGMGLIDVSSAAPPENNMSWMMPVAWLFIIAGAVTLTYILTRPSKPSPNCLEVTP